MVSASSASGRFVLRMPPGLHRALRASAAAADVSLNTYCVGKLSSPGDLGDPRAGREVAGVVERAAALFGEDLVGVLAYGSWARGESADTSDLDVLVVVDPSVALTRALFARWDDAPVEVAGRPVEPMFVHLPPDEEVVAGLWGEVAIDGLVLFEVALRLSARLAKIRRDIIAGRIVRKISHGQAYWTLNEVPR